MVILLKIISIYLPREKVAKFLGSGPRAQKKGVAQHSPWSPLGAPGLRVVLRWATGHTFDPRSPGPRGPWCPTSPFGRRPEPVRCMLFRTTRAVGPWAARGPVRLLLGPVWYPHVRPRPPGRPRAPWAARGARNQPNFYKPGIHASHVPAAARARSSLGPKDDWTTRMARGTGEMRGCIENGSGERRIGDERGRKPKLRGRTGKKREDGSGNW